LITSPDRRQQPVYILRGIIQTFANIIDAGILYNAQGGNDLVIVFLSQNLSSPGEAQNTIAQLSRSIYLYYND